MTWETRDETKAENGKATWNPKESLAEAVTPLKIDTKYDSKNVKTKTKAPATAGACERKVQHRNAHRRARTKQRSRQSPSVEQVQPTRKEQRVQRVRRQCRRRAGWCGAFPDTMSQQGHPERWRGSHVAGGMSHRRPTMKISRHLHFIASENITLSTSYALHTSRWVHHPENRPRSPWMPPNHCLNSRAAKNGLPCNVIDSFGVGVHSVPSLPVLGGKLFVVNFALLLGVRACAGGGG